MLKSTHSYDQTDHKLKCPRDDWRNIYSYDQKESQTGILWSKLKCLILLDYRWTGVDQHGVQMKVPSVSLQTGKKKKRDRNKGSMWINGVLVERKRKRVTRL